jgi:hypothetical protein
MILGAAEEFHFLDDGARSVRLYLGSRPRLWGVRACPKAGGQESFSIVFSEGVEALDPSRLGIAVEVGVPNSKRACRANGGLMEAQIQFICEAVTRSDTVSISIESSALRSVGGVPVAAVRQDVDLSKLESSGCTTVRYAPDDLLL